MQSQHTGKQRPAVCFSRAYSHLLKELMEVDRIHGLQMLICELCIIIQYTKDIFCFISHHLLIIPFKQLVTRVRNDCLNSGYCKQNKNLQFICLMRTGVE